MTPRSVQTQNLATLNRDGPKMGKLSRFNGGSKLPMVSHSSEPQLSHSNATPASKTVPVRQSFRPLPKRIDISELPRIPKIKRATDSGHFGSQPAAERSDDVPNRCITQFTGKGSTHQPIRGNRVESSKANGTQRQAHNAASPSATAASHSTSTLSASWGKMESSSFESFKINIPGNLGHSSRLPNPGFCNTFRPVDNKGQQRENPSPRFLLKKAKTAKSEIYDPFDPTGSDSSSTDSSPERIPLTNITRTISIASPKVQTFQTVRRITPYALENIFGSGVESSDIPSSNREFHDDVAVKVKERLVEQVSDTDPEPEPEDKEELLSTPCSSSVIKQGTDSEYFNEGQRNSRTIILKDVQDKSRVKKELYSPIKESQQQQNALKNEQTAKRSVSRSPSSSSSWSQKKSKRKKAAMKKHKRTRSQSRSCSRDRSSRSNSRSAEENSSKSHRTASKARQSSSDCSSSRERSKKRKTKGKTKDKKAKNFWRKERKRSRSRSVSPGDAAFELYESRKKKKHSSSRAKGQECSQSTRAEKTKKKKHRREKRYGRYEERISRSREQKISRSKERRKRRSRSPSPSKFREHKRKKCREKQQQQHLPRSRSKERKCKPEEQSPLQEQGQRSSDDSLRLSVEDDDHLEPEMGDALQEPLYSHQNLIPVEHSPAESNWEIDLEELSAVGQTSEKFATEAIAPEPGSKRSQTLPDNVDSSTGKELTVSSDTLELGSQSSGRLEEIAVKTQDSEVSPFLIDALLEEEEEDPVQSYMEATSTQTSSEIKIEMATKDEGPVLGENIASVNKSELEAIAQGPVLKSKPLVKRVTWNLQEEESDTVVVDKTPSKYMGSLKGQMMRSCK